MIRNVVVVGASLAGLRAVETLRTGGFDGTVTLIGDEAHLPYDRPPLSKRLLSGEWEPDRVMLRKPDEMASLDVTWRRGVAATALDVDGGVITLADGDEVAYEGLIVATGASARRLSGQEAHSHAVVLRTLEAAAASS